MPEYHSAYLLNMQTESLQIFLFNIRILYTKYAHLILRYVVISQFLHLYWICSQHHVEKSLFKKEINQIKLKGYPFREKFI